MQNKYRKTLGLMTVSALSLALMVGCSSDNSSSTQQDTSNKATKANSEGDLLGKVQPLVQTASQGQFKALSTFDGPDGLVGVVLENQGGNKLIAWTTENGEVIIPGPVLDKNGTNLSDTHLNEHAGYISATELADKIQSDDLGFVAGTGGPTISVFFEPYCGYCNQLFKELKPLIDSGDVRVRFLMVGFLRPDSLDRAAAISYSSDAYKALTKWEEDTNRENAAQLDVSQEQKDQITATNQLMNSAGQSGTPAILYCTKGSNEVAIAGGKPQDIKAFVDNLSSDGHELCK